MTLRELLASKYRRIGENYFSHSERPPSDFEKEYIAMRARERRLYTDSIVLNLPDFIGEKTLEKEWKIRAATLDGLKRHLSRRSGAKKLMELGCGNGWLSHRLAAGLDLDVVGVDINQDELRQASRLFRSIPNLTFLQCDIFQSGLPPKTFDCIIIASCLQYFNEPQALLDHLLTLIGETGEIHIVDSPLYRDEELRGARERSAKYFESAGSGMGEFYFHHSWSQIRKYKHTILNRPVRFPFRQILFPSSSPFPWIKITR